MQAIAINQGISLGQTGTAVQSAVGQGGDFMQLIMQMMGQNPDGTGGLTDSNGETVSLEKLLGMTEGDGDTDEDSDYLMQLMASMLGHGVPQLAMYSGEESTEQQLNVPSFADVVKSGSGLPMWSTGAQSGLPPPVEGAIAPNGRVIPFPSVVTESTDMPMEILSKTYNPTGQSVVTAEEAIQNAFAAAAKPNTAQIPTGDKKQTEAIDIDALQQEVYSGKYMVNSSDVSRLPAAANPQTMDILAQVKTGILANMDKGSKEFVIKLSPEGLGEITIKMTEVAGKVSMSIITGSQQTQNALAGEISTLREALRPLGAEVSQVITQQEANLSQSFAESRHGRQGQEQQQANHLWNEHTDGDEQQQAEYAAALSSALNTYI